MKNVIVRNEFRYSSWDTFHHVMRLTVSMVSSVDADALNEATQEATERFPYFCCKIVQNGADYDICHNDAPIPFSPEGDTIKLGSSEANGHFLAVGCKDNKIFFDIYHNMTDAKGVTEWAKCVVYLYLIKTADADLSPENIRIPGQDFLPGETDDPYEKMDLEHATSPFYIAKTSRAFLPDHKYATDSKRANYTIKASVKDTMKLAKSQDGSPVVVLSYFVKEMLKKLYPDMNGLPVVCGIPHSVRELAAGEANYHNQVIELSLIYDEKMDSLSMDKQFTCSRGRLILQGDSDNVLYRLRERALFNESLEEIPEHSKRRQIYKDNARLIIDNPETAAVSYVGQIKWGSTEKYIERITIHSSALAAPILMGIFPLNGWFNITVMLDQTADILIHTLVDTLNENGIETEYGYRFDDDLCTIEFPY